VKALDFNFDLNLVQSQKILLTPQLKQALEILRMTSQELFEYVEEELEKNPVLEVLDSENPPDADGFSDTQEEEEWDEFVGQKNTNSFKDDGDYFSTIDSAADKSTVKLSLKEHLVFQLHTSELTKDQALIGEYLIDNIDDNGYLTIGLNEAAAFFNIPVSKVGRVLEHLQSFDPAGICARSLKECLLIQLRQMDITDKAVVDIIENHLDDLAANKLSYVAKCTGLDMQRVVEAFEFIKTLEPKPGRAFSNNEDIKYIIPDIIVRKIRDRYEVIVNEDSVPLIGINEYYKKIVSGDLNGETRKFMQNRLDSAVWLIKCVEQRKLTLRKVAESIVSRQEDFFEKGKKHIRPLTMKEVARDIDMHESTVSRTVNGKYIQCTWGVFEMRYFFSGKISSGSGEAVSTEKVKDTLKNIIKEEDKKKPLNDGEIAELFQKQGINISRRTIAKYRAEMDIPTVSKRKRY